MRFLINRCSKTAPRRVTRGSGGKRQIQSPNQGCPSHPLPAKVFSVVVAALLLGPTLASFAADQVVLNNADYGAGSLRQAIADVGTGETITFDSALDGQTITLGGTNLQFNKSLTIDASALTGGITISGNNASRVFLVYGGTSTMNSLTLTGGNDSFRGGAINLSSAATLTIINSTLSGNTASGVGGAINKEGNLSLTNCTLSGNISGQAGGGIANLAGLLTLSHCTLSSNVAGTYGGGFYTQGSTPVTVMNSIIAGNVASSGILHDIYRSGNVVFVIGGANLIGDNSTVAADFPAAPLVGTADSPLNPLLAPLGNNGGPTQTMPPLAGSPAIDAASSGPATDQRGVARPQGANFDIGAVEVVVGPAGPTLLTAPTAMEDGSYRFTFNYATGATFTVLANANVASLPNAWSELGPATETPAGSGQYQFTDTQATNNLLRFYRVRSP